MAERDNERGDRPSDVDVSMAERFSALFEHMQEGVALHEVVCDEAGRAIDYRILDVNDQYAKHTGLHRNSVAGKLASEVYGTGVAPYLEEFGSVGLGGPPLRFEVHFPPLDRHFSISVAPLGHRAFATIFSDITLSKKQAEAIEKSRLSQRALLDNQPHLAWLKDRDGKFLAVNKAFAEACGQASSDVIVGMSDLDVWPPELAKVYQADDAAVIRAGVQKAVEERIVHSNGTRWFETYKSPVFAPDGSIVGTTGVARDITERKRAEEARLQSERKFERVFDLAPDPIAVTSVSGEMLYVNRAFCKATGYDRLEVLGHRTVDLGIWENPELRSMAMDQLKREGHFDALEMTLLGKDGSRCYMEMSGALTEIDGANVMITAARDITASRLAEAKAKAAAETLAQYFSLSLDLLCISDRDARFVRLNPAWAQVLGRPLESLEDTKFLDLVHPEDIDSTLAAMARLGEGGKVIDFQNRFRHADGSWRWLEWRSVPDGKGLFYAVARDITQRYADEQALRTAERAAAASKQQLLNVSELAHIGHFAIDLKTGMVTWTQELYRIFDCDPQTFMPTIEAVLDLSHQDDREILSTAVRSTSTTGEAQRLNFRVQRPSGEIRHCLAIIEVDDVEGLPAQTVYGLVQDLTELRRAEAEQRKLEQQVMQSQKLESLGVLAGGIAHDFNNLLTSILGNADLALSELSPASPACTYLEDIEKVSRRAADLCRQMLAYSGKGRFVVQPISLNEVVREMAYLLNVSISKKVVVKYNFFRDLPSVMADATQLRQVVMNLITNASEAIAEVSGVVTLSTGVMDCDEQYLKGVVGDNDIHVAGQYVYLEVSDTGCGMDSETLNRIFDPFFTTKFTGRGLGLAAVLGIVRGHKGALRVYSEKGHGTTFKVLLPAHHQPAPALEPEASVPSEWRGSGLVLLADDEESIRSMGRHLLERAGFDVLVAADGREAVELFIRHRGNVRLVVLDMTMPHLDGEACFRELRRSEPDVKVIMTSGYNEQDVISRFVGKGLAGFVQKPYKASDILPIVRRVLGEA